MLRMYKNVEWIYVNWWKYYSTFITVISWIILLFCDLWYPGYRAPWVISKKNIFLFFSLKLINIY